jgi:hypothetical protein
MHLVECLKITIIFSEDFSIADCKSSEDSSLRQNLGSSEEAELLPPNKLLNKLIWVFSSNLAQKLQIKKSAKVALFNFITF